jgi:7-carboxy-7-deazaguanine synthase
MTAVETKNSLFITEIFFSLQGESRFAGLPCAFVRLTGCNLRCTWCDTAYGFHGGKEMSLDDIVAKVETYGTKRVEMTGGEPLLQAGVHPLMQRFLDLGYEVLIETGGSLSIEGIPRQVCRVVDVKCPGSGEAGRFAEANWDALTAHDEVKFVLKDRADFDYAALQIKTKLRKEIPYSFSPVHGVLHPAQLAEWMLQSGLDGRLNLQLHKYLWGNEPGR